MGLQQVTANLLLLCHIPSCETTDGDSLLFCNANPFGGFCTNVTRGSNGRGGDLAEGQVWPLVLKTKEPGFNFKLKSEFDRPEKFILFFFLKKNNTCKLKKKAKEKDQSLSRSY